MQVHYARSGRWAVPHQEEGQARDCVAPYIDALVGIMKHTWKQGIQPF